MNNIIILDSDEENGCTPLSVNMDIRIIMEQDTAQSSIMAVPNEIPNSSKRRRPRKSVLYTKPNTEVQFEMITNENIVTATRVLPKKQQQKTSKIVQNIPDQNVACEKFLSSSEVKDLINRIAEERVRINYLLTANDIPKMQFSLYTLYEQLRTQFEKRLYSLKVQQDKMQNAKSTCSSN